MKGGNGGPMEDLLRELRREEEKLFNCVHCGFCLPACPTYTRMGDEADSPRGRLHFMRALVDGRVDPRSPALNRHLDRCLGCRACESVCPSGVEYGRLLEGARSVTTQASRPGILPRALSAVMASGWLRPPVLSLARALRATGFPALAARRLPGGRAFRQARLGLGMIAATSRPSLALEGEEGGPEKQATGMKDREPHSLGGGARVGMLLGCVQEGLLARVNRATRRVLEANGFRVVHVPRQACCGAIHAHTGDLKKARDLARRNIEAFEALELDWLAVNAAGCGAAMKDYPHLLAQDPDFLSRARQLAERVRDISELMGRAGLRRGASLPWRVAYDAPCHLLHAQKVSGPPQYLLDAIPALERAPLRGEEECCGGAGVYGITHPELGGRISQDKVDAIRESGAQVVATGNPGCMMQIGAGLRMAGVQVDVVHPVELLDESYRLGGIYE